MKFSNSTPVKLIVALCGAQLCGFVIFTLLNSFKISFSGNQELQKLIDRYQISQYLVMSYTNPLWKFIVPVTIVVFVLRRQKYELCVVLCVINIFAGELYFFPLANLVMLMCFLIEPTKRYFNTVEDESNYVESN